MLQLTSFFRANRVYVVGIGGVALCLSLLDAAFYQFIPTGGGLWVLRSVFYLSFQLDWGQGQTSGGLWDYTLILLFLAMAIFGVRNINVRWSVKVATIVTVAGGLILLNKTVNRGIPVLLSHYVLFWFSRFTSAFFGLSALLFARQRLPRIGWSVFIGSEIAAGIDVLHPPYAIFDYLGTPLGIFNVGDLCILGGLAMVASYGVFLFGRLVFKKFGRENAGTSVDPMTSSDRTKGSDDEDRSSPSGRRK